MSVFSRWRNTSIPRNVICVYLVFVSSLAFGQCSVLVLASQAPRVELSARALPARGLILTTQVNSLLLMLTGAYFIHDKHVHTCKILCEHGVARLRKIDQPGLLKLLLTVFVQCHPPLSLHV